MNAILSSGVATSQRLGTWGGKLRGSGGPPAGSRGGAPVGIWRQSPQKLKNKT